MTSNYPIHDPAEIEALPDGEYQTVNGEILEVQKGRAFWLVPDKNYPLPVEYLSAEQGGIACRLVPEGKTVTEPLPGGEDRDCSDVAAHAIVKRAEVEEKRDAAIALRLLTRKICTSRTGTIGEMGRCYLPQIPATEVAPILELLDKCEDDDDAVDYVRWAVECSASRAEFVELLRRVFKHRTIVKYFDRGTLAREVRAAFDKLEKHDG